VISVLSKLSDLLKHSDLISWKWLIRVLVTLFIALLISYSALSQSRLKALKSEYDSQTVQLTETLQRAHDESVSNGELRERTNTLVASNEQLKKDVKDLKARPTSAGRVIVVTEGIIEEIEGDCPDKYIYRLASGMVVARHAVNNNIFTAETYDVDVEMSIVTTEDRTGKKYTYIDSTISSSESDDRFPVDITANFAHAKPNPTLKLFDPHANIGISIPLPKLTPRVSFGISTTSIGPTTYDNTVRFSNVKLEAGKSFALGIDPIGVNLSKLANIPLIQDTWLWAGTTVEVIPNTGTLAATVSIGSTL
jgi:cell division protein FtsB